MQHVTIYRQAGRYAGWPANYGIWSWGREVVAGYTIGYFLPGEGFHPHDPSKPFLTYQSRTLDGGITWDVQPFAGKTPGGCGLSADEHVNEELRIAHHLNGPDAPQPAPSDINFAHPDFALMCARSHLHAGARSWFYISYDRCRSWQGPYDISAAQLLPGEEPGIAARTAYLVDDARTCTLLLSAAKSNGREGRVFAARIHNSGEQIQFLNCITPEPEGYAIMPAGVRLSPSHLLCAVRYSGARVGSAHPPCWIDLYTSHDNGHSWQYLNRPVADTGKGGNPPAMTRLHDGRLLITYGFRNVPFAIQATLSEDNGATWSAPITLREGAGDHDLGYPRTTQLDDGTVITTYYWNDPGHNERYIAATRWKP
jgi:hypothetical protein